MLCARKMKKTIALLLIILLPALLAARVNQSTQNGSLVFNHVTVIGVTDALSKSDMTVIVTGNRIAAVGKTGKIKVPKNSEIVDASGKFLIPGLWDMHVHVDDAGSWMFPLFVANGVVGVRDMGSNIKQIPVWREMSKNGTLMPQIIAAGPIVSGKIGDNDPRMVLVGNRREAIEAVDRLAAQGADFIKVHDWISREAYLGLIEEARKKNLPLAGHQPVSMTAEEISNLGQKSVEHFGNTWGGLMIDCSTQEASFRKEALDLIPLTAEEFNPPKLFDKLGNNWTRRLADSYSAAKADRLARVFRRNKTWFDPTIYGSAYVWTFVKEADVANDRRLKYMPLEAQKMAREAAQNSNQTESDAEKRETEMRFYQNQLNLVRAMKRAGVGILAGTDALPFPPVFPGFSLHDELEKLVEAGLSPAEALQSATVNPAKFFGKEKELGTIEKGKLANLVLLDANPLENISNTKKINAVVLNGRLFDRNALDKMLADVENAALMPDKLIEPVWELYTAGRDPAMEWILAQPLSK